MAEVVHLVVKLNVQLTLTWSLFSLELKEDKLKFNYTDNK